MGDSSKEAGKVPKGKDPGSEIDGNLRNGSSKKNQKFSEIDDENWRTLDIKNGVQKNDWTLRQYVNVM